ncbi:MAG: transposase family protein [Pseudonocardiaceae bacterium]
MLVPHLADVVVERVEEAGGTVLIWAHPRAARASCPRCGGESGRVHSRYERTLADAAVAGQRVEIRLRVRRFSATARAARRGPSPSRSPG